MAVAEVAASAVIAAVGESVTTVQCCNIKKVAMGAVVCYGFTFYGNKCRNELIGNEICKRCP